RRAGPVRMRSRPEEANWKCAPPARRRADLHLPAYGERWNSKRRLWRPSCVLLSPSVEASGGARARVTMLLHRAAMWRDRLLSNEPQAATPTLRQAVLFIL